MESLKTRGIPSRRAIRLRDKMLSSHYDIDHARIRSCTRVWRRMGAVGDREPCKRAATALAETLRDIGIWIGDDERLVGTKGENLLSEHLATERYEYKGSFDVLKLSLSGLRRVADPDIVQRLVASLEKNVHELEGDILPFWRGKTAQDLTRKSWEEQGLFRYRLGMGPVGIYRLIKGTGGARNLSKEVKDSTGDLRIRRLKDLAVPIKAMKTVQDLLPDYFMFTWAGQGHLIPGYHRVLELGFEGISEQAKRRLEEREEGDEDYKRRKDFLESAIISAEAVCDFAGRYADLAESKAAEAAGKRKTELEEVAERCRRVPAKPASSFMEALQSMLMTQVALVISYGMDNIFSAGRMDQYLYPYYLEDISSGRITREQALEAVEEFLVKVSGNLFFGPNNITIGGVDKTGDDAVNEVSYIFLEALENIGGMGNGLAVRISHKTPPEFLIRACEVHQVTAGVAFHNDDILIRDLMDDGYSLEDARNYAIVGCVEPAGSGDSYSPTGADGFMLAGVLEMALNRGRRLMTGTRTLGVRTPDPREFRTFEDVKDAFERQLRHAVRRSVRMTEVKDRIFAEHFPVPLLSSTIEGCLESGQDATRGGARYNHGHINEQGLATVANSLAAIRWAVFETKVVTMEGLLEALRNNFKGHESLRRELLSKAPKFGNDDPRVDDLAQWVSEVFTGEARKHKSWRGDNYRCSMLSSGTQFMEGTFCGATPDGRLAGEEISNGISPVNGTEQEGMTATMRSVAVGGSPDFSLGSSLNIRINPTMLQTEEGVGKLASLLEAYFVLGGRHVQFNPLDAATLRDAQAHPERYPGLTVKVTGYSYRFADISRQLQDDIIARYEFNEVP